jgi:hypothetical protein
MFLFSIIALMAGVGMAVNNGPLHFEKLNETNYNVWVTQMVSGLHTKSCAGTLKKSRPANAEEGERWDDKDAMALAFIFLQVEEHILRSIEDCKTAQAAMVLLANIYSGKLVARTFQLQDELMNLRLMPTESISLYVNRAGALRKDLMRCTDDKDILKCTDTSVAMRVLLGLPHEYGTIVDILTAADKLPSMEDGSLLSKLLPVEARINAKADLETKAFSAMHISSRNFGRGGAPSRGAFNGGRGGGAFNGGRGVCYICKKPGHVQYECPFVEKAKELVEEEQAHCAVAMTAMVIEEADGGSARRRRERLTGGDPYYTVM